jgi:hypothetical protein
MDRAGAEVTLGRRVRFALTERDKRLQGLGLVRGLDESTDDLTRRLTQRNADAVHFVRQILEADGEYDARVEAAIAAFIDALGWD